MDPGFYGKGVETYEWVLVLLAHVSQRLIGELIGYPWSGVVVVRPSTISNVFSSETAWPIKAKFHVEHPWQEERKSI